MSRKTKWNKIVTIDLKKDFYDQVQVLHEDLALGLKSWTVLCKIKNKVVVLIDVHYVQDCDNEGECESSFVFFMRKLRRPHLLQAFLRLDTRLPNLFSKVMNSEPGGRLSEEFCQAWNSSRGH